MINANKEYLSSFFQNQTQYIIPFYQRAYVWKKENWETLWENIYQIYSDYKEGKNSEHFIGTLITKQRNSTRIDQVYHDLIDGQQRLTTISLLLKAIADTCKNDLPNLQENINSLLLFKDARNASFVRITHNRYDEKYFNSIMKNEAIIDQSETDHKIIEAYQYFKSKVNNITDDERDELKNIILKRVPVISMLLSSEDDEQVIFDTINSLGVKLTTAELLKNYIFKEDELKKQYENYWLNVFEDSEDHVEFWNKDKTAGRIIRTNIEILLYCYLIINTLKEVRLERLFKEYKEWLSDKDVKQKQKFLEELKNYADIYFNFPEGEELNELNYTDSEKRFFHVIENLQITTVYPLVMFIYGEVKNEEERLQILGILESYLVRRNICKLTTKNYNNLFISIIQKLISEKSNGNEISADIVKAILCDFKEDSNVFPNNEDFKHSFKEVQLSNQNSREILFIISLYQQKNSYNDVVKLSSLSFSVEHFMPVKWEQNWKESDMTLEEKSKRNRTLKTLGNLTLVKKKLNSKMSNSGWTVKKGLLKNYSSLKMTIDYIDKEKWDEESILKRSEDLFNVSLKTWPK